MRIPMCFVIIGPFPYFPLKGAYLSDRPETRRLRAACACSRCDHGVVSERVERDAIPEEYTLRC